MSAVLERQARRIEHRGAVARLRLELEAVKSSDRVLEYVVEGPRGTGKSNGVAYLAWKLCRQYPKARILVIRTARSLLTDTFCKTYEEDICPGHPSIGAINRTHRHEYHFPSNDSRIVLGGLDQPTRYYGSDWDVIIAEEAVQFAWKDIEPFLGSLRNGKLPFHAIIYPTNPDAPGSWVNRRANDGLAKRMVCYHKDNPSLWDMQTKDWTPKGRQFMQTLKRYTGVQYDRHVLGLWRGIEGAVWENYDQNIHIIDAPRRADGTPEWKELGLKDFFGAMDWGFTAPGSLSIYGRDNDKRLVRVAQIYQTKRQLEWWAERVVELDMEFGLTRIVCDPSRPDAIALVNDHLAKKNLPMLCDPADNKKASSTTGDLAGLDLVRWGFEKDEAGIPRIRFVRDALRYGTDPELVAEQKPLCTEDEIPSYAFARDPHGELIHDRTDPDAADHGCDDLRYACAENWKRSAPKPDPMPKFDKGSMGSIMRHADEFKPQRRHRPLHRMGIV